ncbi:hypothetical protein WJX72_006185 [[Myrmecia] bisecta]|uniref:MAGE domain-containing protein n=1 Tax=[Myrmecia] bisecta TaxID=41462 RepID=A0AAW1P5P7_9CHLO
MAGNQDEAGPSNTQNVIADGVNFPRSELQKADELRQYYEVESQSQPLTVSEQEGQRLVREVMRLMLMRQHSKPDVPVKRAELSTLINANYKNSKQRNLGAQIIPLAQYRFAEIFGLEMKEVKMTSLGAAAASNKDDGQKSYVLRSMLPAAVREAFVTPPAADNNRAFCMTVLSLLQLADNNRLSEEDLWAKLDELGLKRAKEDGRNREEHPVFGRPEEELSKMLQKRYLLAKKEKLSDGGSVMTYFMGDNALDEIGKRPLEAFLDEMFTAPIERPAEEEDEEDLVELNDD